MRRTFLFASIGLGMPAFGVGVFQCGGSEALLPLDGGDDRTIGGDAAESGASKDGASDRRAVDQGGGDGPIAEVGQDVVEQDVAGRDAVDQDIGTLDAGCISGMPCTPAECATGITECTEAGKSSCLSTGVSVNGTACDAGGTVCYNGSCNPCSTGAACTQANPCKQGSIACSTGTPICAAGGNAPDGTSCGTNEVCSGGDCVPCVSGAACTPANPCASAGMTSCDTGQSICMATANVADGTTCGTSGLCCDGVCATCSTTVNATNTCLGTTCEVTCQGGLYLCNGLCVDQATDNNACGATCRVCPTGSTCVANSCVIDYGDFSPFAPCNTEGGLNVFAAGHLLGQSITVSAEIALLSLGVVGQAATGAQGILALYSDVDGSPSALLAQTATTTINAGANVIPVTSPILVVAGNYWIVGEYSAAASLCVDSSTTNMLDAVAIPSYGTVPATFGTPTSQMSVDINYYVYGILQ